MGWTPATKDEVLLEIARVAADSGPEHWPHYRQLLCDHYPALIERSGSIDKVWVVARMGRRVVFFEDIEDNFVTATELNGTLVDCADRVDLRVALEEAQREAALGR